MSRVLLLFPTHTYRASAFLAAAGQLGIEVVVGSEQAHVLAGERGEGFLTLDFQDLEGATEQIVAYARAHPLTAVISTDDDAALLAAMASDALGLTHNRVSAVAAARNKHLMRQILAEAGLPSSWFRRFTIEDDPLVISRQVRYPCVVKPLALSASRGVMRANTPQEFVATYRRVVAILQAPGAAALAGLWAGHILVEGYIPGEEVALEGLLNEGQLKVLALFDKPDPLEGPYFEETIYLTPSRHPQAVRQAVVQTAEWAAAALGVRHGPIHAEMRLNDAGVWLVEVAPRSIGGHCSRALQFDHGLSLEALILLHALGRDVSGVQRAPQASGVMMIPIPRAGVLQDVQGIEAARQVTGVTEVLITIPAGEHLLPAPEGNRYLGFIFARCATPDLVEVALRQAHQRLRIDIQP